MTAAPPMVQVVHTALAQAPLLPPSFSASSREPSASVASTATVMAVPNAMAKVAATPAQNRPCVTREDEHEDGARAGPDADREHHGHDLSPGERPGKLPRVDDVIARLALRMVMSVMMVVTWS